jgi:3-aminobutyryl-CoA ammonia-lyase
MSAEPGTAPAGVVPAGAGDPRLGLTVRHQRYVPYSHAHYGGNLVDGAYVLALFGDVATEASIRADGDEGLFASYADIQFRAPVLAGDVIEVSATITRVGRRSREMTFEARVVCRAEPERGPSAARVLDEPLVVVSATGTVVAPPSWPRRAGPADPERDTR